MKKLLSVVLCLLMIAALLPSVAFAEEDRYLEINETNFPDENFRNWIIGNLAVSGDADSGYYMTEAQVQAVDNIYCRGSEISSLQGIAYFTGLSFLDCNDNRLTVLDVSGNTALTYLDCTSNQLTELDVRSNTALEDLMCSSNQLTALDVNNNSALKTLYCYNNQLAALDVSNNKELWDLCCSRNQLTVLDVSGCTALVLLVCDSNQLTLLDVSGNPVLAILNCNTNQLTALDVSRNTRLMVLNCFNNQLTALDVSSNSVLEDLMCSSNQLTALDVSDCTALTELDCHSNQLTTLDVSSNPALTEFRCYNNQLTALYVGNNPALTELYCGGNQLTALDISQNSALYSLNCAINQLTALDVSSNPALTSLWCGGNQLTALDVSSNPALTSIDCRNNQLMTLDISNNPELEELLCDDNQLTEMDVSNNSALTQLLCVDNELTELDVSSNPVLEVLHCRENHLSYLDLSQNTSIREFQWIEWSPQQVLNQQGTVSGGAYTYDLSQIVPSELLQNVVPGDGYQFDANTGVVTFTEKPESFAYAYRTGYGDETMNIIVYLTFDDEPTIVITGQCGDNLYWSFDEAAGTLTITGSGEMWDFSVDSDNPWADLRESIKAIELPNGLTYIGNCAFCKCEGLTTITVPEGVTRIGNEVFEDCTNLQMAELPYSLRTMGNGVFYNCRNLSEINLPDGMTDIGDDTFMWCLNLSSVVLPRGLTSIGSYLFYGSGLKTITIPVSVKNIYNYAFAWSSLTDVYYGGTEAQKARIEIESSNDALLNATWHYAETSGWCGEGLWWEFDEETGVLTITGSGEMYFGYGTTWAPFAAEITAVELPDGLTCIAGEAFSGCTKLTEITIPDSVTTIYWQAFSGCTALTEIVIPDGVTSIWWGTFSGCTSLVTETIPDSVTFIGEQAFKGCTSLKEIEIPGGVENIDENTFFGCASLKSAVIGSGVKRISLHAFGDCTSLTQVTIPDSVTYIECAAFKDSNALTDVYYNGTKADRDANLRIDSYNNDALLNATWHYLGDAFEGTVEWNAEDVKFKGSTPYVIANGSAQTPRFTVKDAADGSVIDPANYDFEFKENTNAGTGYVIVTFKGEYTGTCRGWFKIYLPATTETTVENISDGIRLTWKPVEGAAGYVIYRRAWSSTTNGWTTFERWNNTTGTTYIDGADASHKVYAGTRYQYGVKAYFARRVDPVSGATIGGNVGDNYNLGEVGPLKTTVRITTRTLSSVTPGTRKMTVKWSPSSVFSGYQIQYSESSKFNRDVKTIKITDPKTAQTVIKNLSSGSTYFVRIRSYHEFNGMTYFGGWSNVLKCKVK